MSEWLPERECRDGEQWLGYAQGEYAVVQWMGSYWSLTQTGLHAEDGEWWPQHCAKLLPSPQ